MLTRSDLKQIGILIDRKLDERIKPLLNELVEMFMAQNERIDKVLLKLEDHQSDINEHERRIERVEEKVFNI